jgi:hypothetical protein
MSARNRCDIYTKIDSLDSARSLPELTKQLKVILNELAYYAVTGEGAVMESHEQWREEYTDALYSGASSHGGGAAPSVSRPSVDSVGVGKKKGNSTAPKARKAQSNNNSDSVAAWDNPNAGVEIESPVEHRRTAAPPTNRPRAEDIPASLRAIMEGTHPSLHGKDTDD